MIQGREIIDFLKKRTGVGTGTPAGQYAPACETYTKFSKTTPNTKNIKSMQMNSKK